jgi:hypothetical protein
MRAIGRKINNMDKVLRHGETQAVNRQPTLVTSSKAGRMVRVDSIGKTGATMKETLPTGIFLVSVDITSLIWTNIMKESLE